MNKAWFDRELFKNTSPVDLMVSIKELDYPSAKKYITYALKHPFSKAVLYNKFFLPDSIQKLARAKNIPNSKNLEGELAWLVFSLLKYNKEISAFLDYESRIEELILMNEFEKALELLDKIEKEISYSFWSIELRFSIEEKLNGSEKNWFILNEINQSNVNNSILLFSHFYSKKAENDISLSQYERDVETLCERGKSDYSEYLNYKLGHNFLEYELDYSCILSHENISSVIDKYLLVISVLTDLIVREENRQLVQWVVDDLTKLNIKDKRLLRLTEFNNLSNDLLDDFNIEILEYMDLYSAGKYFEVLQGVGTIISKYPHAIELYEIYISSLLEIKEGFIKTNVSKFIDEILFNMYEVYSRSETYLSSRETLLKLSLSFAKINFFNQLHSLISILTNTNLRKSVELKYFICSRNANPQLIFLTKIKSNNFFDTERLNAHLSLQINQLVSCNENAKIDDLDVPELKKEIYIVRANNRNEVNNNIDNLLQIRAKCHNVHFKDEIGGYIFKYYYNANEINLLISFVIDCYFENKFLTERFNREIITDYVFENNYEIGEFNIDFPIFFHLQKLDSFYLYSALESYLDSLNYSKPSEIEVNSDDVKLIFLLHKVCTAEVLNNFYLVYENEEEVITERINILKKLISINFKDEEVYLDEIATLLKNQKINKTIKTFNDGKISLNFSRIKEDKEYSIVNSYNRFIKFKSISDKNEYSLVDINDVLILLIKENSNDSGKFQDASFLSFKSLVIEIVEQFLFSQEHGLDGDLSTRFRHGEIENSIRNVFQYNNLIANKGKSNIYNEIEAWNVFFEGTDIENEIKNKFQSIIKEFSKNIDDYISVINNELIQIVSNRHQSKKRGVFDYNFSDDFLRILYDGLSAQINSYEDFLNAIFEFLEIYTEQKLYQISEDFKTKVNNQFQFFIDDLHDKLENLIKERLDVKIEVNKKITLLKSNLEAELYNISNWFKINKSSVNTNLDIETIVQSALVLLKKPVIPTLNLDINSNFIRGLYYIDIFKILIENSIIHSEVDIENLGLIIEVLEEIIKDEESNDDDSLSKVTIRIQNNLSKSLDISRLEEILSIIKVNWSNDLSLVNKERGSGFQKIARRLKYDIVVLESTMDFKIENSTLTIIIEIINPYTSDEI